MFNLSHPDFLYSPFAQSPKVPLVPSSCRPARTLGISCSFSSTLVYVNVCSLLFSNTEIKLDVLSYYSMVMYSRRSLPAREDIRHRDRTNLYMYIRVYTYIHTHLYIYIDIYILQLPAREDVRHRDRRDDRPGVRQGRGYIYIYIYDMIYMYTLYINMYTYIIMYM